MSSPLIPDDEVPPSVSSELEVYLEDLKRKKKKARDLGPSFQQSLSIRRRYFPDAVSLMQEIPEKDDILAKKTTFLRKFQKKTTFLRSVHNYYNDFPPHLGSAFQQSPSIRRRYFPDAKKTTFLRSVHNYYNDFPPHLGPSFQQSLSIRRRYFPDAVSLMQEIPEKDDILAENAEKDNIFAVKLPNRVGFLAQWQKTFRTRIRKLNKIERLPKLVTEFETSSGDSFEVKEPKLLQAFRAVGVVPFWEEECPAEYEEQWGERWEHIHETLEEMSNIARKTEVDKFHWTKMDVQDVAKAARDGGWEACLDSE
ncbi:hypothetical protein GGU10DRAFT_337677, partial [Lentinula aff. detonsa]